MYYFSDNIVSILVFKSETAYCQDLIYLLATFWIWEKEQGIHMIINYIANLDNCYAIIF